MPVELPDPPVMVAGENVQENPVKVDSDGVTVPVYPAMGITVTTTLVVDAIPPLKFKGLLTLLKTSPETTPAQLLALRFKS